MLRLENIVSLLVGRIRLRLERQLTCISKLFAILAVLLKSDNPHEYFVFHEETILSFLKCNVELKGAKFSAPLVPASLTLEFKISCLDALHDEEFITVPLLFVLLNEHFGESFLASPLDRYPL